MQKTACNSMFVSNIRVTLTTREKEILQLISQGFSSDEIASDLFLGSETVRTYRKSLLQKFRARNTAHLIRSAFERGILAPK
ncbi:MAG: response regulator transcription factor [Saprospiraceae bacterium]|nr:response regulator transcription factor [Saprospiraceae bacterium]